MKKTILKIVSITAAFFLGLMGMGYYLMAGNADSTAHMASATLPLIYLERGGRSFNLLHGYTESMDAAYIRDAVLPLSDDRTISIRIESPDTSVRNVYYEVRSTNMERLIEDGELTDLQRDGDEIRADFQLMDLLEEGEEYLLVLRLELEQGREVWYYTHLSNILDTHLDECLDFVDTIHNALFDKNNTVSIAQYMETDSTADNDTLDHVTIHSRYNQMIWADMDVQPPSGEVRTYITEIEDSVASIRLEYEVDYVNENGETESYEVTEAYRVRYTDQRMYLLNYDRKTDRIFDPSLDIFSDTGINLGILNTEVEYRKNEEENIVGFVQNGQLWSYDAAQNKLALVFGFREGSDLRGSYDEHGIRILDVSESGSMNFLVYGYMNRGTHEGETGIALYTYDALANSVEERVFIESSRSFAALEAELGELAYVNNDQQFYLFLDGNIVRIDLNTLEYENIVTDIEEESCMVSSDGRFAAWHQENSLYESGAVTVLDLETGTGRTVSAQDGYYIQALGFMGTDFIYGEARQSDVQQDIAGNTVFPMGRVVIQDQNGNELRTSDYESLGKYVVSISIENNRISLSCVQRSADGSYTETSPETITSRDVENAEKISLETRNSGDKKREYYFALSEGHGSGRLRRLTPEQVLFEGSRSLALENETADERYYAYGFDGSFLGAYTKANAAILEAYDAMGSVVDGRQAYIWKRGGRSTRVDLGTFENPQQSAGESSLQAAIEILLGTQKIYSDVEAYLSQGYTPYEILTEQSGGRVLDLSGCSISMIQYYISQGCPVLAMQGGNAAELITGYDQQNIIVTDPLTGESSRRGLNDSTQMYEGLGNLFLVCLPAEET